jgi:hypothetical protein
MDFEGVYNLGINWLMLNGPKILIAVAVFFIGQWIIRFCRKWLRKALFKKNIQSSVKPFVESLIVATIQVFLFIVVMQILRELLNQSRYFIQSLKRKMAVQQLSLTVSSLTRLLLSSVTVMLHQHHEHCSAGHAMTWQVTLIAAH